MENKFSVRFFNAAEDAVVEIVNLPSVEQAIQFALNLHQSSNVAHEVLVRSISTDSSVLILTRK